MSSFRPGIPGRRRRSSAGGRARPCSRARPPLAPPIPHRTPYAVLPLPVSDRFKRWNADWYPTTRDATEPCPEALYRADDRGPAHERRFGPQPGRGAHRARPGGGRVGVRARVSPGGRTGIRAVPANDRRFGTSTRTDAERVHPRLGPAGVVSRGFPAVLLAAPYRGK